MRFDTATILAQLDIVRRERERREHAPALAAEVVAIKRYQQQRFAQTYADLLATPRYAAATRFFLEELYGPTDFARRDTQFARIVPTLVRFFSQDIIDTVGRLAELHALSETLDTRMAESLGADAVDAAAYVRGWRATGEPAARDRQVALMLEIGRSLDRLLGNPLIRHSLKMMRGPASAAGLMELQRFLERGLDAFRAIRGASQFLAIIEARERDLARSMFGFDCDADAETGDAWRALRARLP